MIVATHRELPVLRITRRGSHERPHERHCDLSRRKSLRSAAKRASSRQTWKWLPPSSKSGRLGLFSRANAISSKLQAIRQRLLAH